MLVDYFTITLDNKEEIPLSIKCGDDFQQKSVKNGSLLHVPFQCSALSPDHIFLRPMYMRTEKKEELDDSMLQRESKKPPLVVQIQRNEVGEKINRTIAHWDAELAHLDHDNYNRMKGSSWISWPSWETILTMCIIGALTTGLMMLGKTLWTLWTGPVPNPNYLPVLQESHEMRVAVYKKSGGNSLPAIEDFRM